MDDANQQKVLDKQVRKVKACLKRLQASSDNLKELLTTDELKEFTLGLTVWDKFITTKINK